MSPAPRKKKDEDAPTAAEVEAQASEEAAESVPKAEDKAPEASASGDERSDAGPAKKPRAKKAAPKADAEEKADAAASEQDDSAEGEAADEPKAEDKPKRTRKKAAEPKAEAAEEAKEDEAEEDKPKAPARKRDQPRAERARGEAPVVVRAQARYVRTSARKARLVCDHIRGKDVEQARAILSFTPRGAAKPWLKLLESAIANAEHNHELVGDELKIHSIHADEGPTLKRYRPRAMGRATRIRKRTSHLTITLTPKE
jgi:ribosomal protein L22